MPAAVIQQVHPPAGPGGRRGRRRVIPYSDTEDEENDLDDPEWVEEAPTAPQFVKAGRGPLNGANDPDAVYVTAHPQHGAAQIVSPHAPVSTPPPTGNYINDVANLIRAGRHGPSLAKAVETIHGPRRPKSPKRRRGRGRPAAVTGNPPAASLPPMESPRQQLPLVAAPRQLEVVMEVDSPLSVPSSPDQGSLNSPMPAWEVSQFPPLRSPMLYLWRRLHWSACRTFFFPHRTH